MSVESHVPRHAAPSVHVVRARKLLLGGAVGGLAAAVVSIVVMGLLYGRSGVGSGLLAAAMVLFFYGLGQYVMVRFADAGARTLLIVSMTSYTARVVVLGLVLLVFQRNAERWDSLTPMAVFLTTIAVVAGWLVAEIAVFSRLRIGVYDTEYDSTVPSGSAQ